MEIFQSGWKWVKGLSYEADGEKGEGVGWHSTTLDSTEHGQRDIAIYLSVLEK